MKLSSRTRYGTRFMVHLARYCSNRAVLLRDVASREDISMKYLSQIVIPLKNRGLIGSIRGARGGYFLTRDPKHITLKEIIEALEDRIILVDCLQSSEPCERSSVCVTRKTWKDLTDHMNSYLDSVTLYEMIRMDKAEKTKPSYSI